MNLHFLFKSLQTCISTYSTNVFGYHREIWLGILVQSMFTQAALSVPLISK